MTGGFEGKTAIITGAGGGVGRAAARKFAEQGARLVLSDADEERLEETREIAAAEGVEVACWRCDLRERLGVANLVARAVDKFARVDMLVNAALATTIGRPLEMPMEALDKALTANVRSVFLLSQAVAKLMLETATEDGPAGSITNLTSIAGRVTTPELLPYSVSCAALDQLTRSMAAALAPDRIRVNAVAIGAVMTRALRDRIAEHKQLREAILHATPMGRIAEAEEAAEAVLFLADKRASFVTGAILTVDGGRSTLDPLAAPIG